MQEYAEKKLRLKAPGPGALQGARRQHSERRRDAPRHNILGPFSGALRGATRQGGNLRVLSNKNRQKYEKRPYRFGADPGAPAAVEGLCRVSNRNCHDCN
uniref:Uncharacterized protein n=1 Tax=Solanum tuberosum TaxID=4113 RepID=M1D148_SOLTU